VNPATAINLKDYIRDIPDFPKPGVVFKDITPLLADGDAFAAAVSGLACHVPRIRMLWSALNRGVSIFGAALAQQVGLGLIPVRKPGKLPAGVHGIDYELEYGVDRLEIHRDASMSVTRWWWWTICWPRGARCGPPWIL
jgi:Adenine/guanine phosphoribosyltransferases and related PRPP-binding proteins